MKFRKILTTMFLAAALLSACPSLAGVTRDDTPEVFVEFSGSAQIDLNKVFIYLDGVDVTSQADVRTWRVSYIPGEPLAPGEHTARVIASDISGRSIQKTWKFTVDPNAPDAEGPVVQFRGLDAFSGEALSASDLPLGIGLEIDDPGGAGVDAQSVWVNLYRDNRLVHTWNDLSMQFIDGGATLDSYPFETGNYTLVAQASDKLGNRGGETYAGFSVDLDAPVIKALEVIPGQGGMASGFALQAQIADRPAGALKSWSVEAKHEGKTVFAFEDVAREGANRRDIAVDGKSIYPSGLYEIDVLAVDYAGNGTKARLKKQLSFGPPNPELIAQRSKMIFKPEPLEEIASEPEAVISGVGKPGLEITVLRNGAQVARDAIAEDGLFLSSSIRLVEGVNEFSFETVGADGLPEKIRQTVSTRYTAGVAVAEAPGEAPPVFNLPEPAETDQPKNETSVDSGAQPEDETSAPDAQKAPDEAIPAGETSAGESQDESVQEEPGAVVETPSDPANNEGEQSSAETPSENAAQGDETQAGSNGVQDEASAAAPGTESPAQEETRPTDQTQAEDQTATEDEGQTEDQDKTEDQTQTEDQTATEDEGQTEDQAQAEDQNTPDADEGKADGEPEGSDQTDAAGDEAGQEESGTDAGSGQEDDQQQTGDETDICLQTPGVSNPKDGEIVKKDWVELNGKAGSGCTIQVLVNGELAAETKANEGGHYNFAKVLLDNGANEIKVRAMAASGAYSLDSAPVSVVYEIDGSDNAGKDDGAAGKGEDKNKDNNNKKK